VNTNQLLSDFQFFDKYSRFSHELGRRETWAEAVQRSVDYLRELSANKLQESDYAQIKEYMLEKKAFPSMRLFAMAGEAARRDSASIYNCSAIAIDSIDSMIEVMALCMAGCGVGFSVEQDSICQLPEVSEDYKDGREGFYVIPDSTDGWLSAFRMGLETWFDGGDIEFDYSEIRPAGSVLKVKGGRASGPQPLMELLDFSRKTIMEANGRQLTSVEVYDIVTKIADCVVSGGVRRSALICLFDYDDMGMRHAKDNGWWKTAPQRANANNSIIIEKDLSHDEIKELFMTMHNGGGGEPGLHFRKNVNKMNPGRRGDRDDWLLNPCGEVNLRGDGQLCNLTQAIARPDDTLESLAEKVRCATIIGTIQSLATNFPFLRPVWRRNCEEERLLGVDVSGQMDAPHLFTPENLDYLRQVAIDTNKEYAGIFGINQSAAVTCNKPSGNSSLLFDSSPGLHSRWSDYYIRRFRVNANSPMRRILEYSGMDLQPENGQKYETATTFVAEFPVKAPDGAITNGSRSAIEQCEWWKMNKLHWTEHNPSVTILYGEDELPGIIDWVYGNQHIIGGMAFLPRDDHYYPLAPYEKITKKKYDELIKDVPEIDWEFLLPYFENEDNTTSAQELACMSGSCEL
jgi:ribonucleoside-diphosphate reductase alpha chain